MTAKDKVLDSLELEKEALAAREAELLAGEGEKAEQLKRRVTELQDKLREFERKEGWGWEDGEDMMSMTDDSPAIFGVPNHQPHPANNQNHAAATPKVGVFQK